MDDLCALCQTPRRKAAAIRINDVPLCGEHGRIAAMKRLDLTEEDLEPSGEPDHAR